MSLLSASCDANKKKSYQNGNLCHVCDESHKRVSSVIHRVISPPDEGYRISSNKITRSNEMRNRKRIYIFITSSPKVFAIPKCLELLKSERDDDIALRVVKHHLSSWFWMKKRLSFSRNAWEMLHCFLSVVSETFRWSIRSSFDCHTRLFSETSSSTERNKVLYDYSFIFLVVSKTTQVDRQRWVSTSSLDFFVSFFPLLSSCRTLTCDGLQMHLFSSSLSLFSPLFSWSWRERVYKTEARIKRCFMTADSEFQEEEERFDGKQNMKNSCRFLQSLFV
jgi:hypothetical protein